MSKIGMDPNQVRALSSQIDGQLSVLDQAQNSVGLAALASTNPLGYMVDPGGMILSQWSIVQANIASAEITLARASAQELVAKLLAEAGAQEWASSDIDALYFQPVAWRTADAKAVPDIDVLDLLDPFSWVKNLVSTAGDVWGAAEEFFDGVKRWAEPTWKSLKGWYDGFPPWAKGLAKVGKLLPWAGLAITAADLGVAWSEGDVAGMWHHGVSALADVVSFVPGPVGWVAAGVGIVWDVGWTIGEDIAVIVDDPLVMSEYYLENPGMALVHGIVPLTMEIWGPLAG